MARSVKRAGDQRRGSDPLAKTRISSKHQVTIANEVLQAAGLRAGDVVAVRALGPGRVELTRLDELFAEHRGIVKGDAGAREAIDQSRDEWG
jgi:bifunctional DNA-binding transcriptional regulator/antitoxin component of YhaV-PrlF toxin-antitoxin module